MENMVSYAAPATIIFIHFFIVSVFHNSLNFSFTFHLFVYCLLGEYIDTYNREVHIHVKHGHNVPENVEATKVNMPFVMI
jgi:hypothetical protein